MLPWEAETLKAGHTGQAEALPLLTNSQCSCVLLIGWVILWYAGKKINCLIQKSLFLTLTMGQ